MVRLLDIEADLVLYDHANFGKEASIERCKLNHARSLCPPRDCPRLIIYIIFYIWWAGMTCSVAMMQVSV